MKKKEKVYCNRCRYYIQDNLCCFEKSIKHKHTPTEKITIYGNVHKLNKRNTCKNYELATSI
jgi:hypothetical protein